MGVLAKKGAEFYGNRAKRHRGGIRLPSLQSCISRNRFVDNETGGYRVRAASERWFSMITASEFKQPFWPFFSLAALDAIAGVSVWLLPAFGFDASNVAGTPIAFWHRQELFFGMAPAMFTGFILTALPRWTRSTPVLAPTVAALVCVWFAARIAHAFWPDIAGPAAAFSIALLALIVADRVAKAANRRNIKVVALLSLLALGSALSGSEPLDAAPEIGSRLGLAAILGLLMVVGGRVVPSVTQAFTGKPGNAFPLVWENRIERATAVASAVALGAWVAGPTAEATGLACGVAAIVQAARLANWQVWRVTAKPQVLVLHAGYAWIPAGFAFASAGLLLPDYAWSQAALHAWTAGAMGVCSIAVMSSMIRRHTRTAFRPQRLLSAAYVCIMTAAIARLAAVFSLDARAQWLGFSALAWISAYTFFIFYIGRALPQRYRPSFLRTGLARVSLDR